MSDDKTTTAAATTATSVPSIAGPPPPAVAPTGMKFTTPNKTPSGYTCAINGDGTYIQLNFAGVLVALNGTDAKNLRNWLNAAELRTPAEAAALVNAPHDS